MKYFLILFFFLSSNILLAQKITYHKSGIDSTIYTDQISLNDRIPYIEKEKWVKKAINELELKRTSKFIKVDKIDIYPVTSASNTALTDSFLVKSTNNLSTKLVYYITDIKSGKSLSKLFQFYSSTYNGLAGLKLGMNLAQLSRFFGFNFNMDTTIFQIGDEAQQNYFTLKLNESNQLLESISFTSYLD